jgi:hypothetical protein
MPDDSTNEWIHSMATTLTPDVPAERIVVPIWSWLLVAVAAFGLYLMVMENGAVLGQLATHAHELFHDARHFAGVPCH